MKTLYLTIALGLSGMIASAQEIDVPQDVKGQEKIKAARIGLITQRLGLTPDQAEKFWPIYNEFADKRNALRKEFKTAEKSLDPKKADPKEEQALVDLGLKLKQQELNLEKDYSGKMMNIITAQQLLNLRQAERDFRNIIINQLQQRRQLQDRKENFRNNQRLRRK